MSQSRQYLTGLCFVLLVAMAITPTITNAETATTTATSTITAPPPGKTDVSSLLTLLKSLMKQVEDLQKQLAQVRTELKDGLHEGMTDEDVKKVQELLATDPTLYPKGLVTGYYGPMTKEAIMRFQTRHGLEATGEINAETKALMLEYFKERKNGRVPEGLLRTQGIGDQMKLRIKTREIECEQKNGVTFCKNREGDNKGKNRINFNSTSTINNNIECEQEHGQMVCKSHDDDDNDEDEDGIEDEDEEEEDENDDEFDNLSGSTTTANSKSIITKDGLTRTYNIHLPKDFDKNTRYDLVVALHGGYGSGLHLESQTNLSIENNKRLDKKFIIIYPDGYQRATDTARTWNAGGCCGASERRDIDDVAFIKELVSSIKATYRVGKVYATGMSNGAMLTQRLACEASDVFSKVAPVAGTIQVPVCEPANPIGVLMIHGTDDAIIPYNGGGGTATVTINNTFVPVEENLSSWATNNQCSKYLKTTNIAPLTNDGVTIKKLQYNSCEPRSLTVTPTMLYKVIGGTHSWPGGSAGTNQESVTPTQSLNASKLILDFFAGLVK